MDVVLLLQRTECRTHLPPFRYQPTDLLSLETKIRSPRPDHPGRAFAPAAPGTQTHLVGGTGRTGAGSAQAVSALGQRQAGGASAEKNSAPFLLRWSGTSWCNSNGAGRCTSHRDPPCCGRHDGNCGIVHGLFASLNTGESSSPETWWRLILRKFACTAACF